MTTIDLGDVAVVTGTFAKDPTTVTAEWRREDQATPTDMETTFVPGSTYTYTASFKPDTPGRYYIRMTGTGANEAAEETQLVVRRARTLAL